MKKNTVERQIMWGDLDPAEIVFYPRFYEWFDASGHLFMESLGLDLDQLWKKRQVQFGLVETGCQYTRPGRYHEKVRIVTSIEDLAEKTLTLRYQIYHGSDDLPMVSGFEKRICMDVTDSDRIRAMAIPSDIYAIFAGAAKGVQTR